MSMTVMEAIGRIDKLKPNGIGMAEKIRWLSMLDGIIKKNIIDTHAGGEAVKFSGYTEESLSEKLIVGAPYDDIYVKWLEAQIDYAYGEYDKYNNSMDAYNTAFSAFERAYHREHLPKNTAKWTHF